MRFKQGSFLVPERISMPPKYGSNQVIRPKVTFYEVSDIMRYEFWECISRSTKQKKTEYFVISSERDIHQKQSRILFNNFTSMHLCVVFFF